MAIDQFQFLEIDKGCELFPPEAQPPTTPTTTEYTPTEPPNRKYHKHSSLVDYLAQMI